MGKATVEGGGSNASGAVNPQLAKLFLREDGVYGSAGSLLASGILDTAGADITEGGTQSAGSAGLAADSGHTHPIAGGNWVAADHGLLGMNADYAAGSGGGLMVANTIYLQKIVLRKATTITNLWYGITVVGVGASTGAGSLVAVYNSAGTRMGANSADVSGTFLATGWQPFALGSPQALAAGVYYAAIVVNLVTTQPTLWRMVNTTVITNPNQSAASFRWATNGTGALPSSLTLSSNAATAFTFCVGWS